MKVLRISLRDPKNKNLKSKLTLIKRKFDKDGKKYFDG